MDVEQGAERGADLSARIDRLERELAEWARRTDPERGHEGPDLARIERSVRNLAFVVERDREALRSQLAAIQERLGSLDPDAAGHEPIAAARPSGAEAPALEVQALRRQVIELQRSVADLRQPQRVRERRRRAVLRVVSVPLWPILAPIRWRRRRRESSRASSPGQREGGRRSKPRRRGARPRIRRLPQRARRVVRLAQGRLRELFFGRRLSVLEQYSPRPLKIPRRYRRPIELADPPSISIVTPSFNQGRFLDQTIRSVLDQGYPRLEYIVQDGGSTDETAEVLARNADRLHHWESRADEGQGHAINLGFQHASPESELMAYLNSDDLLLPGSLAYVARYFQRHPEVDVVYGHRVIIDAEGREIGRWVMPRHDDEVLSWADWVPQETMVWRRRIWERSGGAMDQSFKLTLDWDLLLRFREAGAKFARLPRFLGAFRVHETHHTGTLIDTVGQEEMTLLRRRALGREVDRPELNRAVKPYRRRNHVLQKLYRARLLRY